MHKKRSSNWVVGELPSRSNGKRPPIQRDHPRSQPGMSRAALQNTIARYRAPRIGMTAGASKAGLLQAAALLLMCVLLLMIVLHTLWPLLLCPISVAVYMLWRKGMRAKHSWPTATLTPEQIQVFEACMLSQMALLPEKLAADLQTLQEKVRCILNSPQQALLSFDDRHFIQQLAARYLPDLCSYYHAAAAPSTTAAPSFQHQCALLSLRLEKIQMHLDECAGDALRLHEQFLQQKLAPHTVPATPDQDMR